MKSNDIKYNKHFKTQYTYTCNKHTMNTIKTSKSNQTKYNTYCKYNKMQANVINTIKHNKINSNQTKYNTYIKYNNT